MAKVDNTYRLVLFVAPEDSAAVRDLLCGVTGLHPTDVMQWVARAPGIWPQPLAEGEVREILDRLYEQGLAAEAWRLDALPTLSPPRTIHSASCLPEGLRVQGLRGEPTHWVPWERVELIAAGRIAAEDEFREIVPPSWVGAVSTGLNALLRRPQVVSRRQRSMRIPHDPASEVVIVRRDPRVALRVVENKMNYAYLGDRLRPKATENFPLFLADLCARAAQAYITPTTKALLDGSHSEEFEFPSTQALMEYATHRLLWSWYRRDRDANQRTEP
jgi:hypothetical protein